MCRYSWWNASVKSRKLQPGMNWAAVIIPSAWALTMLYGNIVMPILWYADRDKAMEQCDPDCFVGTWPFRLFPLVLILGMLVSVCWGRKKLPRHRRGKRHYQHTAELL